MFKIDHGGTMREEWWQLEPIPVALCLSLDNGTKQATVACRPSALQLLPLVAPRVTFGPPFDAQLGRVIREIFPIKGRIESCQNSVPTV